MTKKDKDKEDHTIFQKLLHQVACSRHHRRVPAKLPRPPPSGGGDDDDLVIGMIWWWCWWWFGDGVEDSDDGDGGHVYDDIDEDNKLTSSNRSSRATMGQQVTWIGFWEHYMYQSPLLDFTQCVWKKNHKYESHCVIEIYWSNKIQSTYNAASTSFPRLNVVDIREYGKGGSSQE